MGVETDAERLEFLRDWDEGLYNNKPVFCIFDAEYFTISGGQGVESASPAALCRTSDVSDAVHGMPFRVNDTDYLIRGVQPDGTGFTLLKLELV